MFSPFLAALDAALVTPRWSPSSVRVLARRCGMGDGLARLRRLLKQPICYLPFALVGLAVIGTLWSDAAWGARLHAISPTLKLLVLPGLIYHFERSSRGMWVFIAFLVSCTLLMLMSCLVAIDPSLSLKPPGERRGAASLSRITSPRARSLRCARSHWPIRSSVCCGRTGSGRRWRWARSRSDFSSTWRL